MSRYVWFACEDCKKVIWLGKEINKNNYTFFRIGDSEIPSSEDRKYCKILLKFMSEHIG